MAITGPDAPGADGVTEETELIRNYLFNLILNR